MKQVPILCCENVTVTFDGFKAVNGMDLRLMPGELRFLIGPNGAGKTTMLDVICGKVKPASGQLMYKGDVDISRKKEHQIASLGIGRKFQAPSIFTGLTVYENIEIAMSQNRSVLATLKAKINKEEHTRIVRQLDMIGLTHRAHVLAGGLSHGEKQWLEIGMMLIQDPSLLLLDEPVAGMTDTETEKTGELLQEIVKERTVVVVSMIWILYVVTPLWLRLCMKASCLRKARWRKCKTIRSCQRYIWDTGGMHLLLVNQLQAGYGESTILRDISLKVEAGKVVCLMGRNGVGKTTLVKSIMGLLKVTNGSIYYAEQDMTKSAPYERAKKGTGYVPQGREIFAQLTVYENILLGLEANNTAKQGIPAYATEKFPVLPSMYNRKGGDLSGGQQQQLAFARALASKPKLLLLDEPTEGIQPSIVQDIQAVIKSIKEQGDTAILLVEQSIDFVKQ